ncbi:hypothetical protein LEP1GSC016_0575 [Leptospira borgpetersenii serovar Hardjo-bovis str. Sponselee]|uniref:Uncharacterized protein n=2 Tax=Leptospira borgpetersenii TaxID=174 RepID=M6BZK6_LEPBO|nr:hypothetical protein LEP1GSC016_0575 [Leptospira borgpetersenii serovar Hardjo-bovis str. Sponselee]EMO61910.1 hypothetical protein LEP1GSC133_2479 [Leptospira borgpetersenii serovar Pomona str. 200901868]
MAHYTRIEFSLDHELNNLNTTPRIAQIPSVDRFVLLTIFSTKT